MMKSSLVSLLLTAGLLTLAGCVPVGGPTRVRPAATSGDVPYPPPITLSQTTGPVEDFVLAGKTNRTVILIGDPDPPEYVYPYWGGDRILRQYLLALTGVETPIVDYRQFEADASLRTGVTYRIWFGRQPKVEAAIGKELAALDDDGYIIKAEGRDLYICGKRFWGNHWAPYDLLERAAGCRWYLMPPRFWMPREDGYAGLGDILPKTDQVRIPGNTFIVEQPSYRSRWFMEAPEHSYRLRYRDRFVHNLGALFPPATYGQSHPEYYPLIGGKRQVPAPGQEQEFQPCVANPDTVDIAVAAASAAFDRGDNCFGLGMNDTDKYCECEACQRLAPASLTNREARIAYAFFDWYNRIAARLYPKYPDRRIGCLAYAVLTALPAGSISLHPMVVPYLTRDSAQLFDPAEVTEFRETVDRWSKLTDRMGIYEYIYGQGFYVPRLYNRSILKNIKERYGVGCESFYAEAQPQWALDAPKYWFISKLIWNHRYRIEDLYNDYYNHMFGPAAAEMRAYFDYLEDVWRTQTLKSSRSNYRWLNDPKQLEIFPPAACGKAIALIDRADEKIRAKQAKAGNEELAMARKRIAFFRQGIEFTARMSRRYHSAAELQAWVAAPGNPTRSTALLPLDRWLQTGTAAALYKLRTDAGLDRTQALPFPDFVHTWCKAPAPFETVHRLAGQVTTEALQGMLERSPAGYGKAVDRVLRSWRADPTVAGANQAFALLDDVARKSGILFVRSAAGRPAPVVDGNLAPGEWGEPVYEGAFYGAYTMEHSANRTTIYAQERDGQTLELAFDCEGDPARIGGDVTGRNTDTQYPRRMAKDDAIAINIKAADRTYLAYAFNVNGAACAPEAIRSAARKTDRGWQLEVSIPLAECAGPIAKTGRPAVEDAQFCISRYERIPTEDGTGTTSLCTTIRPVGRVGATVGDGNHDSLMTFVWGLTVLYENAGMVIAP